MPVNEGYAGYPKKKKQNKMGEDDFEIESGEDEAKLRSANLKAGPLSYIGLTQTFIPEQKKKKQGYDAREDESLGERTGKESGKKQSERDRRDESYGKWGKRDKKKDEKVNKTTKNKKKQGYAAREDESLGMRRGKESGKKQSMRDRRDESYGKWGKRTGGKVNKGKKK